MNNYKFKISGLDCAACASNLEEIIKKTEGIENVNLNFLTEKLTIETSMNKEDLITTLKKIIKKEEPDATLKEL